MKRARSLHLEKQVPPPKEKKLSSRWELTWRIVACAAAYLIVVGFFLYDLRSGQVALAAWCAAFLALFAFASARVWRWAGSGAGWRRVGGQNGRPGSTGAA